MARPSHRHLRNRGTRDPAGDWHCRRILHADSAVCGSGVLLLSYVIAPAPMDLLFSVFELVAIGISVLSIAFIAHDGETHWMEGVQLIAVYLILALGFFFLPG